MNLGRTPRPPVNVLHIETKLIHVPKERQKQFDKDNAENRQFVHSLDLAKQLINPLNVRPIAGDDKGRFELVCGRRRLWAVKQLGWDQRSCKVESWTDQQIGWIRSCENVFQKTGHRDPEGQANPGADAPRSTCASGRIQPQSVPGIANAKTAMRHGGEFAKKPPVDESGDKPPIDS